MGYRTLEQCVNDLEKHGHLIRVSEPVDACLEVAEIHRRVFQSGGPALLFEQVKNCRFRMVSNLFGTIERSRFMFRDTIEQVRRAIELKIDPSRAAAQPWKYWRAPLTALTMRPKRTRSGPLLKNQCRLSDLPQMKSWPDDGGPFVTLPQVYSQHPEHEGLKHSNLGMYRIQLAGNDFVPDREIGLHYQIHRGIGVHHQAAAALGRDFPVNVFVGGTPAMTLSAVMPLPEGMSELTFAGALSGYRIPMAGGSLPLPVYGEADFAICGRVRPGAVKPEGPFGDHLGYYSLVHDFPVLEVERVFHRDRAIWPFTVVGRPPQEDSQFGALIHELTGPIIPTVLPGVREVNAVDAAGVHPLLLAVGSERYTPFSDEQRPMELLTQANAILGQGQMSLAKYLWIANAADMTSPNCHHLPEFFQHMLERADWQRDLHFQTQTTIDTLDYSGQGLNLGSKLVIAARGPARFELQNSLPGDLELPTGFQSPKICLPGVLAIEGPRTTKGDQALQDFCRQVSEASSLNHFRLIVLVDDSDMASRSVENFVWITFTRSNPAVDIDGIRASTTHKHWGCGGPLVIDARIKPHHAPPLVEAPEITQRVDALASRGGELAKYL
jgi:4-hydroxy-3-polyprenylbenzoate decarboxylase